MTICVGVWIWLTVGQVTKQHTLVIVLEKTTLLYSQRVHLLTQMKNLLIKMSHQMTKPNFILRNTWCNFEAISLLVILVASRSLNIFRYCWWVVFLSVARAMPLPTCLFHTRGCVFESAVWHSKTLKKYIFGFRATNSMIGLPLVLSLKKPTLLLIGSLEKPRWLGWLAGISQKSNKPRN